MSEARYSILVDEKDGYVRVFLGHGEPAIELSRALSKTLASWMKVNPQKQIVAVVPVHRDEDTVELHAYIGQ